MNKHYIRIKEGTDLIIYGFSTAFEQPQKDDICIDENNDRHFHMLVDDNYTRVTSFEDECGCIIYKYLGNGKATHATDEDNAETIAEYEKSLSKLTVEEQLKIAEQERLNIQLALVELYMQGNGGS